MLLRFWLLLFVLAGCSELDRIKRPSNFDPKTVARMAFLIEDYQNSPLKKFSAAQLNGVSQEISERFAEAGYPVSNGRESLARSRIETDGNLSDIKRSTHVLQAAVGATALTDMPKGFTLDFGNADPRATNFQKTTTVDISCRLVDRDNKHPPVVLSERKAVPASVTGNSADRPENFDKVRRYYVENIGATCHNLLTKLDIYPKEPVQTNAQQQSWDGVEIKTEYEAQPSNSAETRMEATADPVISTAVSSLPEKSEVVAPESEKPGPLSVPIGATPQVHPSRLEAPPPDTTQPVAPGIRSPEAKPLKQHDRAVMDNLEVQSPPPPPAVERAKEIRASETTRNTDPSSLGTQQNEAGDWRKKKITIFNQGNTVILKFGPDR